MTVLEIAKAPTGIQRLKWIGPGIVWMISAIATGELLFTPRIASLYGYSLLWAMVIAIVLKALVVREIGRYAVVSGDSVLPGMHKMPGPSNWLIWFIILPQIFVAAATIAGMAGATGTAIILALPGNFQVWAIAALAVSLGLVLWGNYKAVEWASIVMSLIIITALIIAASIVFSGLGTLLAGLTPRLPGDVDYSEILPWLGFIMSGAAGMLWYSYWLSERGYGAASIHPENNEASRPFDISQADNEQRKRLRDWLGIMTLSTFIAAGLVLILLVALLILGTELLKPEGLVPEGEKVTEVLSQMLEKMWGAPGRWLMIGAAFFAFWSTIIANLDGWGRMLSQGTTLIAKQLEWKGRWQSFRFYRYLYLLGLMGVIPAILFWLIPEPMSLLRLAGIIEAVHIPLIVGSILHLNHNHLPDDLKPSKTITALMLTAGLFFLSFAAYYLFDLIRG